jgi:Na+-driven multidrug efflux pump
VLAAAAVAYFLMGAPGFEALATAPPTLVLLLLATIPARLVVEYWGAILRGMNRIQMLNLFEIGGKLAPFLGVVILVWALDLGVAGAAWSDALACIAAAIVLGVLLRVVAAWRRPMWDSRLWWRVLTFALPVHAGTIAAYLNYRVDEFIVAAYLPIEALGLYAIAAGLAERIWIIPGSVATVLLPHLTNRRSDDATISAAICRHVIMWTGAACIVVWAIARLLRRRPAAPLAPARHLHLEYRQGSGRRAPGPREAALHGVGVRRRGRHQHRREPSTGAAHWDRWRGDRVVCVVFDSLDDLDRVVPPCHRADVDDARATQT